MLGEPLKDKSESASNEKEREEVGERERETHFPHHRSCSVVSSRTTRLSLGDRPVLAPERVARAPLDVMKEPCSYLIACSYSSAFVDSRTRRRNRAS